MNKPKQKKPSLSTTVTPECMDEILHDIGIKKPLQGKQDWEEELGINWDRICSNETTLKTFIKSLIQSSVAETKAEIRKKIEAYMMKKHDCDKGGCKELDYIYKLINPPKKHD